jgi:hypothetical protein
VIRTYEKLRTLRLICENQPKVGINYDIHAPAKKTRWQPISPMEACRGHLFREKSAERSSSTIPVLRCAEPPDGKFRPIQSTMCSTSPRGLREVAH